MNTFKNTNVHILYLYANIPIKLTVVKMSPQSK